MKQIIITSTNPVKQDATIEGFKKSMPDEVFEPKPVSVESGVSVQPMSDEETLQGALNRISKAKEIYQDADYWVGIEGGIEEKKDGSMYSFAYIVILAKDGTKGIGRTAEFMLPPKITKLVKQGMELGPADDLVFGRTNSKQSNGAIGILTKDLITRTTLYEPAVIIALIPIINPELYKEA